MKNKIIGIYDTILGKLSFLDGLPALLFRLILAPVMIIAGYNKLAISGETESFFDNFLASPDVVQWFGNSEWGLGLPFPDLLAFLAGWSEFLGGWFLLLGLLTRLVSIPLMFTMVVAATSVHWHNGWFAIAPTNPDTSAAQVLDWLSVPGAKESLDNSLEVQNRIGIIRGLVEEHGSSDYLYEKGKPSILNNGIEFSAIYFAMLFSLFFMGGGRFVSIDYWLKRVALKE
ncbi:MULTISPECIES: HvfX family Cu-binding RiPP maturation protein [Pseudoalteromonas]|uniref:Quinol oxidase n=1 Tax=Pseudoalteromonas fuliginea TaxID=1872678 RepID=A0ABD3YAI7_9GAMM|nr:MULTISPECIES: DoxX family protein [Pseudoalteromonas]KDC51320.1 quinol oxidase [Pseudoalteromonas fuliginea]KDC54404.1 quinol oxidase [Pseudoalteromonas sp. S3431]KJZ28664.1 quinol oxidase [Pseudoalteromonas fuliginea]